MASRLKLTVVAGKPVWTERSSRLAPPVDGGSDSERAALAAWWGLYFRERQYRDGGPEAELLGSV